MTFFNVIVFHILLKWRKQQMVSQTYILVWFASRGMEQIEGWNVGYQAECSRCEEPFAYIGETSRTSYTRFREHFSNYRSAARAKLPALPQANGGELQARVKSFMWEHTRDFHEGQVGEMGFMGDFKASVVEKFSKCLPRQVNEDIKPSTIQDVITNNPRQSWQIQAKQG